LAENVVGSEILPWSGDWLWSLLLIVLTVVIHAAGLGFIGSRVLSHFGKRSAAQHPVVLALAVGAITLVITILHAFEALAWAVAYLLLGALTSLPSSILYSLSAMTSYGHANLYLSPHWQMMGALEALNGWLLFGLTTAFLFAVLDQLWRARHNAR
jgi:hypothetical protein